MFELAFSISILFNIFLANIALDIVDTYFFL